MFGKTRQIHFVGIGGIGMSGIAELLINLKFKVSGSDLAESSITRKLKKMGAVIAKGHAEENIKGADVVVISSAVKEDNPEVVAARQRQVPVIPRAEMLAELMRLKQGIAIAGSHGKTTTTSMVATVLGEAGLDPTAVIGGRLDSIGSNAKLGEGKYLVAEADESDGSFVLLSPTIAVVTNIDVEHMDFYGDMDQVRDTFLQFVNKVPFYGLCVLCLDCENVQALMPNVHKRTVTYGMTRQADWRAKDVKQTGTRMEFEVVHRERGSLGKVNLGMPGIHMVYNALAAFAVADELGIEFQSISGSLKEFGGVQRRFDVQGEVDDILVVDDYGHHPTEIKATLEAAKNGWDRRLVVAFQPHRYSRTQLLFQDFVSSFNQADVLLVSEIYAASEAPIEGVTGEVLAKAIGDHGFKDVRFVEKQADLAGALAELAEPGDLVITLGAGTITKTGGELIELLKGRSSKK